MSFDPINSDLLESSLMAKKYYVNNSFGYYNAVGDSESEAEGEAETENEDFTEYENEEFEIGDTSQTDLPKFRDLVRLKKAELKAQYGKAHIERTSREVCVNVPYTTWDSNINCSNVCVKWNIKLECTERKEKCLGGFIGGTRRECTNIPYFKWVSGWRKKWREFKRNGGLNELKMMSKGMLPIQTPIFTTEATYISQPILQKPPIQPTPEPYFDEYQDWTCQELSDEFGIISGQTFGTAPKNAITSWINRKCNTTPNKEEVETENEVEESGKPKKKKKPTKSRTTSSKRLPVEENKILGMPKDVAITVGVVVLALGTFMVIRKIMK